MSSIQGVHSSPVVTPPKAQAVQPAKPANGEAKETKRAEAPRPAPPVPERQPAPTANPSVGTRFSTTA